MYNMPKILFLENLPQHEHFLVGQLKKKCPLLCLF